jgi:hypothetical protein
LLSTIVSNLMAAILDNVDLKDEVWGIIQPNIIPQREKDGVCYRGESFQTMMCLIKENPIAREKADFDVSDWMALLERTKEHMLSWLLGGLYRVILIRCTVGLDCQTDRKSQMCFSEIKSYGHVGLLAEIVIETKRLTKSIYMWKMDFGHTKLDVQTYDERSGYRKMEVRAVHVSPMVTITITVTSFDCSKRITSIHA